MSLWLRFTLAVLATWRVSHLVAHEDGPGGIVAHLRRGVKYDAVGQMLDCVYCLSVWIAAPVALWITTRPLDWVFTTLAISGAVSLIERAGHEPIVFHELSKPGEEPHELLRSRESAGPDHLDRRGDRTTAA